MSPVFVKRRWLGVARNGVFTTRNTDPIPGGKLWPEAAASWNAMRAAAIDDGIEPWEFVPAGPNSSARALSPQWYFWNHQPPAAAYPGTSNHGWAIAVDVKTKRAAAWIMRNGHRYGWSHDEGARVNEWWHFRYVGGYKPRKPDPLRHLTKTERRWCREYDRLKRINRNRDRRVSLRAAMKDQRKRVWRAAQKDGWRDAHRRERYRELMKRTR